MSNLTSTIRGNYPLNTFSTVRDLWQQMAREISHHQGYTTRQDVRLVTNAELLTTQNSVATEDLSAKVATLKNLPQFSLLQSERFQALLTGKIVNLANSQQVEIEITFIPANIDRFLLPLIPYLPSAVQLIADPDFTNDNYLQSHFNQLLSNTIAARQIHESFATNIHPPIEQLSHRELNLQQQVAQAHLLNYIITQIHQT